MIRPLPGPFCLGGAPFLFLKKMLCFAPGAASAEEVLRFRKVVRRHRGER